MNDKHTIKFVIVVSFLSGAIGAFLVTLITFGAFLQEKQTLLPKFMDAVRTYVNSPAPTTDTEGATNLAVSSQESSIVQAVKKGKPAVVSIVITADVPKIEQYYEEDPFNFFGSPFGFSIPQYRQNGTEKREIGGGSGFLVSADGLIVTNKHVVSQENAEYTVFTNDGTKYTASVVARDPSYDLAVLKINGGNHPYLSFADSNGVQIGQTAIAIGNALAEFENTVSVGVVSGLSRSVTAGDGSGQSELLEGVIQTDAAINPGNSGGPLVDMNGNLIGVNTFILSRSGSSAGVGFAIPAALVRRVVETAVGGGRSLEHTWLGLQVKPVTAEIAAARGLAVPQGAVVTSVYPGGPAARAGVAVGDVLLKADNETLHDEAGLNYVAATHKPGDEMSLTLGGGRGRVLQVRLTTPPATPKDERTLTGRQPLGGATVINLSPATAENLGLDPFTSGVLVEKVQGLAARLGFQAGDLVLSVNGKTITNTAGLADALAGASSWRVVIDRDGQKIQAEF